MTEAERTGALEQAGLNVLNLDPNEIALDLLTDVPARICVAEVAAATARAARGGAPSPDLQALAERLYGPARYVFSAKGRSAELALVAAAVEPGSTVLTHGLFRTTARALTERKATLEMIPRRASDHGRADVDLEWLSARLAQGRVDAVYLEPSNNALGGWPLSLENAEAVAAACRTASCRLLLDATRLLSNVCALGLPIGETTKRFIALADGFTVSCAKELLVPLGSLVGVRDLPTQRKVWSHCFEEGTLLDPLEAKVALASGIEATLDFRHLKSRARQLKMLADELRAREIPFLEPIGAHAVYVVVGPQLGEGPLRSHALQGLLYRAGGVRALIHGNPILKTRLMRLTLTLGRFSDQDITSIAQAVKALFERAFEAPELEARPGDSVHEAYFSRYARA